MNRQRGDQDQILKQFEQNSMRAFIRQTGCPLQTFKGSVVPGAVASGEAVMGDGVSAAETIRCDGALSLCTATESLDAISKNNSKGQRPQPRCTSQLDVDMLVGDIAPAIGESSLQASAFTESDRAPSANILQKSREMQYRPNDFSSYRQRFR